MQLELAPYRFFNFTLALAGCVLLDWDYLFAGVFHSGSTRVLSFDNLDENGFLLNWLTAI